MRSNTMPLSARRGRSRYLLAGFLASVVLGACSSGSAPAPAGLSGGDTGSQSGSGPQSGDKTGRGTGGTGTGSNQSLYEVNQANLLIIKTGTLQLQVTGLDAALGSASQKITALGGYASGSQREGDDDQAVATVTYRIPATRWDEALTTLRALGTKVLGEKSETQDVTGQVVDLGARIANLQVTEQALQSIMTKAAKITDVLAVQEQLTAVRGQIEQLTAERKHLQEQAAFSTLTVTYSLKEHAVVNTTNNFDPTSEIDRASASLVDVLQGLATAGIWFGIVWLPILLVLGVIALIVVAVMRRVTRARPGTPVGPGGGAAVATPAGEG
jgi:hypothetical protein